MSGIPWNVGTSQVAGFNASAVGCYVKVQAPLATDVCLLDVNFAPNGYLRYIYKADGTIHAQISVYGSAINTQIGSTALSTGAWYWLTAGTTGTGQSGFYPITQALTAMIYNIDGTLFGSVSNSFAHTNANQYTAVLAVGMCTSASFSAMPNSPGWEISRPIINPVLVSDAFSSDVPASLISPPSANYAGSNGGGPYYNMGGTLGPVAGTLPDDSSNGFALTPGPNGMTLVSDGPFPS